VIIVLVVASAAVTGILRGYGTNWPLASAALLAVVLAALLLIRRLVLELVPPDGPVLATPISTDQWSAARRVEVVDAVGVRDALAAGMVPVLRGDREVVLHDGAVEVRDHARVVLHGAARALVGDSGIVTAHDTAQVHAHDSAWVASLGEGISVHADGVSQVDCSAGTVVASGRATVTLRGDGRCQAAEEASVRLESGLVEAVDDARVHVLDEGRGVVSAADRVVVRLQPGVRLVATSADVQVISPGMPGPYDQGTARWITDGTITEPELWASAWRVPVREGHVALALTGEEQPYQPPVRTGGLPALPRRRERVALPWALPALPPRDVLTHAGAAGLEPHLIVWVPLDAISLSGPGPEVTIRAVLSDGAAWLDPHGLPAAPADRPSEAAPARPARTSRWQAEMGTRCWSVDWLPGPIDLRDWTGGSSWMVLPPDHPESAGRTVLVDRQSHHVIVSGPFAPARRVSTALIVAAVLVAAVFAVLSAEQSGSAAWVMWAVGTAALAAPLVCALLFQRRDFRWHHWWLELARRYSQPNPTYRCWRFWLFQAREEVTRLPKPPPAAIAPASAAGRVPTPPSHQLPGGWAWLGLLAGAAGLALCVAAVVPSVAAGNHGNTAFVAVLAVVAAVLAVLPWRPRREGPIDPEQLSLPTQLGAGKHQVSRGSYVLASSAEVEATGTARVIIPANCAAAATAAEYAHVEQYSGWAQLTGRATASVHGGIAECRDDTAVYAWHGEIRASGAASVVVVGGQVLAASSVTVIEGLADLREPVRPALTPQTTLEALTAQGYRPVGWSLLQAGGRRATVLSLDGRLDRSRLNGFLAVPADARWDSRAERLWLPGTGLLVESGPPRDSRARWAGWLLPPLVAIPLGMTAAANAESESIPPGVLAWLVALAASVVVATLLMAAPWLRRLNRRRALIRAAVP
jgi:hypothetical protein